MAPPKRKTGGGRVTPKGTQPTNKRVTPAKSDEGAVAASSRYTPKAERRRLIPPNWIPVIMLVLLICGGLMIMARCLVWTDSNIPTIIGLVAILGGLWAATKWE